MEFLDLALRLLSSEALLDLLRSLNSFSPLKNFQGIKIQTQDLVEDKFITWFSKKEKF